MIEVGAVMVDRLVAAEIVVDGIVTEGTVIDVLRCELVFKLFTGLSSVIVHFKFLPVNLLMF
jgi:hypothetical protein